MADAGAIARSVSHYEIIEKIGEGGMGAVYKARDTRLDRVVALKILPPDRVADTERRARFVQEARAASALNHPNIVTIYDIDSTGDVHFIAMEYVEGETLDRLIGRRGLPLKQAVDYAIQIADGLGKAHAAGIIHRDVKPSNVLVTAEGRVKILDFGLAKLVERTADADEGATRTVGPAPLTEQGQIVGTIVYMSPEQIAGGRLDTRSDIFSFGIVLYEMITGRRPFVGESGASTLQAILSKDPAPPSGVVVGLPYDLERAVLRCLRKDPQRRWQTMGDLKVALEELKDDLQSGRISQVTVAAVQPHRRRWRLLAGSAAALLFVVAALGGAWWYLRPATPPATLEPERVTFEGSAVTPPAISADGKLICYSALRDGWHNLFVQQLGGGVRQATRLTQHETNDSYPSFSPDGLTVVYRSERDRGGLFITDTLGGAGGAERKLVDGGHYPSFSPDGSTVAYIVPDALSSRGSVFVVPARGGTPRRVAPDLMAMIIGGLYVPPLWSPDGTSLLFKGIRGGDMKTRGWWVASASTGRAVPLEGAPPEPPWRARGALAWWGDSIYYLVGEPTSGSTFYRLRVTPSPWRARGEPEKLTSPTGFAFGNSISSDGRLAFTSVTPITNIWSAVLRPDKVSVGPLERVTSDAMAKRRLSAAADGSRIAYVSFTYARLRGVEIRVRDLTSEREFLIAGTGNWPLMDPVLTPDGKTILYRDAADDRFVGYVAEVGQSPRAFCKDCSVVGIFPDGRAALVESLDARLLRQPLDGGKPTDLMDTTGVRQFALSPAGNWVAFTMGAAPGGVATVFLADVSRAPARKEDWKVVAEDRNFVGSPAWSPDGSLLYYVSSRDGFKCVWGQRIGDDGGRTGPAVPVLHLHRAEHPAFEWTGISQRVAVTKDRLFVLLTDVTGDIWSVKLEP